MKHPSKVLLLLKKKQNCGFSGAGVGFFPPVFMENIDRTKIHSEFYPWIQNLWIETTNPTYQVKTAEVWDHEMLPGEPKPEGSS